MNDKKNLKKIQNLINDCINDKIKNVIDNINKEYNLNIDEKKYLIDDKIIKKKKTNRRKSAYQIFLGDIEVNKKINKLKIEKKLKNGEIFKEKAKMWKNLSKLEKQKYYDFSNNI
jgi:hypothetical protein